MRKDDKDYLDEVARGIRAEIKASSDMLNYCLQDIIKRQDVTNNRIYKIEASTRIARWVQAHPRITTTIVVGIIILFVTLANVFDIGEIIKIYLFKV